MTSETEEIIEPKFGLFYDTETTGLPVWSEPSGGENQPHLVQIAAILADLESRKEIASIDLVVRPNGWEIPAEVSEIHGITEEHAASVGVDEGMASFLFFDLWAQSDVRCGHNERFDARIMRIASKRYHPDEAFPDQWKEGNAECTGLLTKPIMQMPPYGRYGYKMPKLTEAYMRFIGEPLEDAHSAMADARACMKVYFAVQDYLKAQAA